MPNQTDLPDLSYFKFRYSCYLHVLDYNNTETFRTLYSLEDETFESVAGIFCFVFAVFIVAANCTFIFGLFKTNRGLSTVQKLFVYVSCMDLLTGFIAMPMLGLSVIRGLTCLQHAFMFSFILFPIITDGFGMLTISLLRVRSIIKPLGAPKQRRRKMAAIMGIQNFLAAGLTIFCFFVLVWGSEDISNIKVFGYLVSAFVLSINAGILTCVSYTLYQIRKKENQSEELSIMDKRRLINQRKSNNTLLIIALVMLFSMVLQMPSLIILNKSLNESSLLSGNTFIWTKRNADFSAFVSSPNTGFNSVILVARSKKISKFLKRRVTTALTITSYSTDSQGV